MILRQTNVQKLRTTTFDTLILGGGINGAVAAASLATKGVQVALIDRGDFAGSTSSSSSNLVWGGIKYLENYEFLLVNKLCKSRNQLMRSYPSVVKEIRFLTTIQKGFRLPPFFVFLGTILYWGIGRFFTKPPRYLSPKHLKIMEPAIRTENIAGGFEYSDGYLHDNDSRFVFNFIRSSMDNGSVVSNYLESIGSERINGLWVTTVKDHITGEQFEIRSKALINACGPYVDKHNLATGQTTAYRHLFSKGIHLVVDRIATTPKVLAFFASDGRLFFVIPMGPKTCIGTTDTQVEDPQVSITDEDREFVLDNVNRLLELERPFTRNDIVAERCGVRPLAVKGDNNVADWLKLSRQHAIDVNNKEQHISIFGGKLTDCINVGDEIADIVSGLGITVPHLKKLWYGEPDKATREAYFNQASAMGVDSITDSPSSEPLSQRLWRRYGQRAFDILQLIESNPDNAEILIENAEYIRGEIKLAAQGEMVTRLDDFLRRRSKIEQVISREDIIQAPGLKEACRILFGKEADEKLSEYILSGIKTKTV
jgi:glycerol-3-phosphate dehydrogenase|tara:strand:- start:4062 stop:5681 length:1620 start_codon:yes stop_codon:yes gene_type:complete